MAPWIYGMLKGSGMAMGKSLKVGRGTENLLGPEMHCFRGLQSIVAQ